LTPSNRAALGASGLDDILDAATATEADEHSVFVQHGLEAVGDAELDPV